MDKNILKRFAIESRKLLSEKIADRINLFYINEVFNEDKSGEVITLTNEKHNLILTKDEYDRRLTLIKRIDKYNKEYGDGFAHVIEEASFTWFNRFICLRYMELHDFLPLTKSNESLNIKVLSSKDGETEPEIMKSSNLNNTELDLKIDKDKLDKLTNINDRYEYVLLKVCEKMGEILPQIFDGETDYIQLLIPKNLLNADSFLDKLIKEVSEENFNNIEVIGWLYQYYNQSEKDRVMKEKRAYKKNEIPYVTQIFTPDWIVKYMVENSLGRLYIEKTGDESLESEFKYFIKDNIEIDNKGILPENIKFIDPCMGSGHILVYAFEVFMKLYENAGYNKKDIPELILKNNLYGLDIDDRAGQFAIISVMLKAREYDSEIFNKINKENYQQLNILSIPESDPEMRKWVSGIKDKDVKETVEYLIDTFENGKEIGSLLIVEDRDYDKVIKYFESATQNIQNRLLSDGLKDIIRVAKILSRKYEVVVTNPPYMNNSGMTNAIKFYLDKNYNEGKSDLCTAFMKFKCLTKNSYLSMINQQAWLSLESFEELRKQIIKNYFVTSMIHLGMGTFGTDFGTTTFVLKNTEELINGIYYRLLDYNDCDSKERGFKEGSHKYNINQKCFEVLPGYIFGYWLSKAFAQMFKNKRIGDYLSVKQGTSTGDNNLFLRNWFEVDINNIDFNNCNKDMIKKWYPANKGGEFLKWYGNNEYVVNWKNDAYDIKKCNGSAIRNPDKNFLEGLTWTGISSKAFGIRYCNSGFVYLISGKGITGPKENLLYCLAFCCSKIAYEILKATSPTISFEVGYVANLPLIFIDNKKNNIIELSNESIGISKKDWDSFETSWDFKKHPLV